jgi:hypothetical protein
MKNKKIECITYCYNYSDFLSEVISDNKQHFDNYIIVTAKEDKKTIQLCDLHNIKCLTLDHTKYKEEEFRGYCLNYALENLKCNDWVINLDADMWLPPRTRSLLESKHLEEHKIYGIDRLMCNSYIDWVKFKKNPKIHEGWIYMHLDAFKMGVRNVGYAGNIEGYIPIGFFQLWNIKGSEIKKYPYRHQNKDEGYDRMDTIHAKKWEPKNRGFIPEIVGVHLDSSDSTEMGVNWDNGRKTPYFGLE